MRRALAAVVAATTLMVSACTSTGIEPDTESNPVVDSTTGTLQGVAVGNTHQFLGVRYAQPPTGDRRWTLPEPMPDTDEVLNATKAGSPCPQTGETAQAVSSTDEDCLFLNVTVPARASAEPRPVLMWWHGGGFTSGAGSQYDAQKLADQGDVIVVSANYRLGMLGYLGLPGLAGSGNFGLADQLAALRWANDNAAAFGGDPDSVTLYGESAGGTSTCAALTSPAAEGLIDRAIFSSGSCRLAWPPGTLFPGLPASSSLIPLSDSESQGVAVATALGCTDPDPMGCLRERPVDALLGQAASFGNPLAYGTGLLPQEPALAVEAGDWLHVPVLSGGNRDEHRSFIGGLLLTDPAAVTADNYQSLIQASFPADAASVGAHYPLADYESAPVAWATLVTDVAWACTTSRGARELAADGTPVYSYEFADRSAPDVSGVSASGMSQGAAHATDLPYLFDLGGENLLTGPGQRELGDAMVAAWAAFAHNGTPGPADGAEWPATTGTETTVMQFDNAATGSGVHLIDHRAEHHCAFWDTVDRG
ncbi:carboxylesterase family protein [Rhodococcus sp. BP-316]|uniref:carboxylesterase/lipase family protein n=1 Tax=Rhodococcus sp. BP-316 TaxID=2739445 RepID=UPI001C9AE07C|nr:carboxylesterase family protein [Rhodococcus sp. BP-316]MBY6682998.1 carboxylesterase family protein [Rhodococcus sp. BP-316]